MAHNLMKHHLRHRSRWQPRLTVETIKMQYGIDTVHAMATNESPYGASPKAIEAMQHAAETMHLYPDFADYELREAIASAFCHDISADNIYLGCSGFEALELIARGFLNAGDEVIVSTPTFMGAYERIVENEDAVLVDVPLLRDDFSYDVTGVLDAITPRTKLVMLCNPNNPTGTIITQEQMDFLMLSVPDHVLVVCDEAYIQFVDSDDFPDSMAYIRDKHNLIVVHTFSKAYGLAGLRLGYGISTPEIATYLAGLQRGFHIPKMSFAAGIAAAYDREHLQFVVQSTLEQRDWLQAQLAQMGVRLWESQGNFILFETALHAEVLLERMLEHGVWLRPMHLHGLDNFMRVSVGDAESNQAFVKALGQVLYVHDRAQLALQG